MKQPLHQRINNFLDAHHMKFVWFILAYLAFHFINHLTQ